MSPAKGDGMEINMQYIKLVYIKGSEIGTRKIQSYPLGIIELKMYAYSYNDIKENIKIDIDVLDYDVQDEAYIFEIYRNKCDMVLFSTYIWNISRVLELCRKIKIVNLDIMTGLGGPEVEDPIKLMKENEYIDIISVGEGEKSFVAILNKFILLKKSHLHGVIYREKNGKIIDTGKCEVIDQLDQIPSIVKEDLVATSDMFLYETSRGCPFQCKYCCWAGKKMRYYSIERVEKDLKYLLELQSGSSIFIIDSELDIDIERAKIIMNIIKKYNIHNKVIQGFLGLHIIDAELLKLCKDANFKFGIGIQSVNYEAIKQCGRTWFDVKQFEEKLQVINEFYQVNEIEFQLIMGLPGDNYESFKKNLQWCDEMGAVRITANRLYVLPGSYFYKHAEEYKLKFDKQPYHLVYSSYSYSYEDIMRSEALLVAFQVSKSLFRKHKNLKTENVILNIWDFINMLVDEVEKKQMYSQGRQESQIVEKEYEYEKILLDNLKKMNCNKQGFVDFIHMIFAKKRANTFFNKDVVHIENKKYIKLNAYFISPYIYLNERGEITEVGKYHIIYLHNFQNHYIKKIKVYNRYVQEIEQVLNELVRGIDVIDIQSYIDKPITGQFIKSIIEKGLFYYTNERK